MMVVVPIVQRTLGEDIAHILTGVLAITAFLVTLSTLLRQRIAIRSALMKAAVRQMNGLAGWVLTLLAQTWHVLAVGYVGMVFLVGLTRPNDALPFIGSATGYSLLTLGAGFLASGLLTQLIGGEVRLKEHQRLRLPRLEQRLNSYLPWIVRLLRALIVISVVSAVLAIWHVVNLYRWLATPVGQQFLSSAFDILFVMGFALLAWLVIASLIEVKLNAERDHMPSARIQTLLALFRDVVAIALVTMTVMMVLSEMGVNIGPLLAGAGVLGLALGFGAQKLVQDVITGIFIQLENAINTGDTVSAGGITGTVENLTIRSAGIRDLSGTYHIVPFSSVGVVSNFMRGYAYHKAEYGIAYRENSDDAIVHLRAAFDELMSDPLMNGKILEPIQIPGVTELAASSVNIRVMIKTTPGDQWSVGRAYNRLVKIHFDAAGIEIPFPHTTIYFGEDKTGQPTSANVRLVQRREPDKKAQVAAPSETVSQAPVSDEATRWLPDESDIDGDSGH
jgi:small-conductance mechanosensitive channel